MGLANAIYNLLYITAYILHSISGMLEVAEKPHKYLDMKAEEIFEVKCSIFLEEHNSQMEEGQFTLNPIFNFGKAAVSVQDHHNGVAW